MGTITGNQSVRMTQEMFNEYQVQLQGYKEQYEVVMQNLQQAKAEGDISDNAAHDIAMRELEQISDKIKELLDIIERASIIREDLDTSVCSLFAYVKLQDVTDGRILVAQLVEANQGKPPIDGNIARISANSQVGKEILGRPCGDAVTILDGNLRTKTIKILGISAQRPAVEVISE